MAIRSFINERKAVMIRILFSLLIGIVFLSGIHHVQAATDCNATIVDEAGAFGAARPNIEAAAQRLTSLGADVRIRTMKTVSGENLDILYAQTVNSCISWQSADTGVKNNLLVFMVATESRKMGLYFGDEWRPALDSTQWDIQDRMSYRYADGEWAGGMLIGLQSTHDVLDLYLHPVARETQRTVESKERPRSQEPTTVSQPRVQPTAPVASPFLNGTILIIGAVLLGGIILVVLGYKVYNDRKTAEETRLAAQLSARNRKRLIESLSLRLDADLKDLQGRVAIVAEMSTIKSIARLHQNLEKATRDYNQVLNPEFDRVLQSVTDPETPKLSTADYGVIDSEYRRIEEIAQMIDAIVQDVKHAVSTLEQQIDQAPGLVETTAITLSDVMAAIATASDQGYRVDDFRVAVSQNEKDLASARQALADKQYDIAYQAAFHAQQSAASVLKQVVDLPKRRQQLIDGIAEVEQESHTLPVRITRADEQYQRIMATYNTQLWADIAGNIAQSEEVTPQIAQHLSLATSSVDMALQDWQTADLSLAEAKKLAKTANSLLEAIASKEIYLAQLKEQAEAKVQTAQAQLAAAKVYLASHMSDTSTDLENRFATLEQDGINITSSILLGQPNYLDIVRIADNITGNAASLHSEAERQVRAAASARSSSSFSSSLGGGGSRSYGSSSRSSGGGGSRSFGGGRSMGGGGSRGF